FETFGTSQSVLGNQGLLPFLCVMRGKYLLDGQKLQELLYIACSKAATPRQRETNLE
ncbi:MAG: hypothetical protein RIR35_903, partial [Actinomycetota bacterium]